MSKETRRALNTVRIAARLCIVCGKANDTEYQKCEACLERNRRKSVAWRKANPNKNADSTRRWRRAHPDKVLAQKAAYRARAGKDLTYKMFIYGLQRHYGINGTQYDAMYTAQGGACALCGRSRRLVVDHDHFTNEVRGLLCSPCNTSLGQLTGDDVNKLDDIRRYMVDPPARPILNEKSALE